MVLERKPRKGKAPPPLPIASSKGGSVIDADEFDRAVAQERLREAFNAHLRTLSSREVEQYYAEACAKLQGGCAAHERSMY
jgi:hypothetical protein